MLNQTLFFYLIVLAVSYGTGSTMYCLAIFNNAAVTIQNFTFTSMNHQISEIDHDTATILYNIVLAIPTFGAIFGCLAGDTVAERYGRKPGILLTSAINILGTAIAALSTCVNVLELMILGRFVQGFAMGLAFCLGVIFIAEISPTSRRSCSLPLMEVAVTSVSLLGVMLGSRNILGSLHAIWLLQGIQAIPSLLTLIWLPFCPETPNYLYLTKEDREKASASILFYQGEEFLAITLEELETEKRYFASRSSFNWLDLVNPQYRKLFIISIVVTIGQAASGISILASLSTLILLDSGLDLTSAQMTSNISLVVAVISALFWVFVLQRTGRKPVFMSCMIGTSVLVCLFCVVNFFTRSTTWAPTTCQAAVIMTSFMLYGGDMVRWFIVEEMFDQRSRSKAVALSNTIYWLTEALAMFFTLVMMDKFGPGYALLPVAFVALLTGVFAAILLPETKSRTYLDVMLAVQGERALVDENTALLAG